MTRNCPVCACDEKRFLFRDRNRRDGYLLETNLVQCRRCGMRYLDPVPSSANWLQEYAAMHLRAKSGRTVDTGPLTRAANYGIARWVPLWSSDMRVREVPGEGDYSGQKVLDIGCGTGAKLRIFKERGFEIYGVDVSSIAIAEARHQLQGDFRIGRFEETDYPPSFFDVIRLDNVLEHVYNPYEFLKKAHDLLKVGGVAYCYIPNGIGPTMTLMRQYSITSWVPFHINLFSPHSISRLANEIGFKVSLTQISHPEWALMSMKQWVNRDKPSFDEKSSLWWDRVALALLAPIWWLMKAVWQGEELFLVGYK